MDGGVPMEKEDLAQPAEAPKIQPIRKPMNVLAVSALGLLVLAIFYTFYLAREFFLPVTMAWILSLLLKPGVRFLERLHLSPPVGSAVLMILLLALVLCGLFLLSGPATEWVRRAPESLDKIERKVRSMATEAQEITKAAETVEHLTDLRNGVPKVEIKRPGLLNTFWNSTKGLLVLIVEVFVLLYFFLAAGELFVLKLIQILPRLREKKRAVEIARKTEKGISQYLLSITLVNLVEGIAIGFGLALLGMPNPLLWGVLAFFANYIPYVGAIAATIVVTGVALISLDSVGQALLAPVIYCSVNFLDNFLAPYVLGKRLTLNPIIVFLAVMFWGWIWGIPGVLLAVPLTMITKIVCDHSPALAPFAEFLTAPRKPKPETEKGFERVLARENA
jgi:predicted PurR-regulated permease PerM